MNDPTIIVFGSSHGTGLLFHVAELAKEIQRQGSRVLVVSGPDEICEGVEDGLQRAEVPLVRCADLDKPLFAPVGSELQFLSEIAASTPGRYAFLTFGLRHCLLSHVARIRARSAARSRIINMVTALRHGTWYETLAYRVGASLMNLSADRIVTLCKDEHEKMRRASADPLRLAIVHCWLNLGPSQHPVGPPLPPEWHPATMLSLAGRPFPQSTPVAIYPAVLIPRKGHSYLLHAIRILRQHGRPVACICLGRGHLADRIALMARELGITDLVAMPGYIHQSQVPQLLSNCDLAVVSSTAETFGFALIEPLLAGIPLVTTRVGIANEIEQVGGTEVVRPRDSQALADAIFAVVSNPESARAKAAAGAEYVRQSCSTTYVAARLRELIADSFDPNRPRPVPGKRLQQLVQLWQHAGR